MAKKAKDDFTLLVGKLISNFGALELLTNRAIMSLGNDNILASEVIKLPFKRRIGILQQLLEEHPDPPAYRIKPLCNKLRECAEVRNAVAHNPIGGTLSKQSPSGLVPGSERILVVKHRPDGSEFTKRMTASDLEATVRNIRMAVPELVILVPSCAANED